MHLLSAALCGEGIAAAGLRRTTAVSISHTFAPGRTVCPGCADPELPSEERESSIVLLRWSHGRTSTAALAMVAAHPGCVAVYVCEV